MNSDSDLTYEEVREIVVGMLDKLERNLTNRLYHRLQRRKGRLPSQTDGREDFSPSAHYWEGKEMDHEQGRQLERRRVSASRSSIM
jgi:hypothetical protein